MISYNFFFLILFLLDTNIIYNMSQSNTLTNYILVDFELGQDRETAFLF